MTLPEMKPEDYREVALSLSRMGDRLAVLIMQNSGGGDKRKIDARNVVFLRIIADTVVHAIITGQPSTDSEDWRRYVEGILAFHEVCISSTTVESPKEEEAEHVD